MKSKKINIIVGIIVFLAMITLIMSGIKIYNWYLDSQEVKEITKEIMAKVEIKEVIPSEDGEETSKEEVVVSEHPPETAPYWDYIKMNLIDVNLDELKAINKDTVGWLKVNGTSINYPFVQTTDNKYYLTHSFKNYYNAAGWVFLDYRNNIKDLDKNTILYAHGRADKIMFSSLKDVLKSDWYNNLDNHVIRVSTDSYNTLWQVFSVYHIKTTNDYLRIKFNSSEEYIDFLEKLKNRSVYDFNTTLNSEDKILTLSTCYNDEEKMVMHAKLIKYSFNKKVEN